MDENKKIAVGETEETCATEACNAEDQTTADAGEFSGFDDLAEAAKEQAAKEQVAKEQVAKEQVAK